MELVQNLIHNINQIVSHKQLRIIIALEKEQTKIRMN